MNLCNISSKLAAVVECDVGGCHTAHVPLNVGHSRLPCSEVKTALYATMAVPLMKCCARRPDAPDPLLDAVLLHCLNHCAKAADRVKSGNERLKTDDGTGIEPPRDQGFARPKVCTLTGSIKVEPRSQKSGTPQNMLLCIVRVHMA